MRGSFAATTVRRTKAERLAWVVIVLTATFGALGAVAEGVTTIAGRVLLAFGGASGALPVEALPILSSAGVRPGDDAGALADVDVLLRVLSGVPFVVEGVTIAVAAWLLLRVLDLVAARQPFSDESLRRWRQLTSVLLVGSVIAGAVSSGAVAYLWAAVGAGRDRQAEMLGGEYTTLSLGLPHWPVHLLVAGLVALGLTAAFRAGARLKQDVDGLV